MLVDQLPEHTDARLDEVGSGVVGLRQRLQAGREASRRPAGPSVSTSSPSSEPNNE